MTMVDIITEKLTKELTPASLEVINESHHHAGHAGSPGTGESHFRVKISTSQFKDKSRLQMHQAINQVLAQELKDKIHALAIEAKADE